MEFIRGLHNLRPEHRGVAATIGNFDGVHLGHQAVVARLIDRARTLAVRSMVILFEPQPQEYFRRGQASPRLTKLREKILALRECGVDFVLCVRFDARFAQLAPNDFIQRVLVDGVGAKYVVVGDDFRFGSNRGGDFALLQAAGDKYEFFVAATETFRIDGERVSSTRVRAALMADDLEMAKKLLGRRYRLCGRVAHGNKLGRTLGVPTANVALHREVAAVHGIYVVAVHGIERQPLAAVASVGVRPTVGGTTPLLEAHILDFDRDIYGAHIGVDFLHKLREERRFDSLGEMQAQILRDIEDARRYFVDHNADFINTARN
jgi:riboflavin kinase / FMN adenylyltransferase